MMAYAREMLFPSEGKGWGRGDADALDPLEQRQILFVDPFSQVTRGRGF